MKYTLLLLFLSIGYFKTYCQINKYRSTSVTIEKSDSTYGKECDVLVVLNFNKKKIQVFTPSEKSFDIVKLLREYKNKKLLRVTKRYLVVDNKGEKQIIEITFLNGNAIALNIIYTNSRYTYNLGV